MHGERWAGSGRLFSPRISLAAPVLCSPRGRKGLLGQRTGFPEPPPNAQDASWHPSAAVKVCRAHWTPTMGLQLSNISRQHQGRGFHSPKLVAKPQQQARCRTSAQTAPTCQRGGKHLETLGTLMNLPSRCSVPCSFLGGKFIVENPQMKGA